MFHIIFTETKDQVLFYERLEADNLVELLSKFTLTIAQWQRFTAEKAERDKVNDDIPF